MKKRTMMTPEEKYNIAYKEEEYQLPSIGGHCVDWVMRKMKFKNVLDVGCGMGHAVLGFLKAGKQARGIESCDYLLETFLKPMVQMDIIEKGRMQQIPVKTEQFDLVMATDVLEHIPEEDIEQCLRELVRVSKKYIFATVSTVPAIRCSELKLHETVKPLHWWDEQWNKFDLKRMKCGLQHTSETGGIYVWQKR